MLTVLLAVLQPLLSSLSQLILAGFQQWQADQAQRALGAAEQSAAALSLSLTAEKVRREAETTVAADPDPAGRLLRDWSRADGT